MQQKRITGKVQNWWISRVVMAMTKNSASDAKRRAYCANRKKDQADTFFIRMSVDEEEYKCHCRTLSKQAEYRNT